MAVGLQVSSEGGMTRATGSAHSSARAVVNDGLDLIERGFLHGRWMGRLCGPARGPRRSRPCRDTAGRGPHGLGPRGSGRPSALSRQAIVIGPSGADRPALASSFRPLRRPCRALRPSRTASWRASKNSSASRYVSWMHALKGRSSSRLRTRRPEPSPGSLGGRRLKVLA